jgi:hypothetical protein
VLTRSAKPNSATARLTPCAKVRSRSRPSSTTRRAHRSLTRAPYSLQDRPTATAHQRRVLIGALSTGAP